MIKNHTQAIKAPNYLLPLLGIKVLTCEIAPPCKSHIDFQNQIEMSKQIERWVVGVLLLAAFGLHYRYFVGLAESAADSAVAPRDPIRRTTLLFAGDWMQHTPQIEAARRDTSFDYSTSIRHIAPLFRSADFSIINFETTLTRQKRYTGYPLFRSPIGLADALSEAGVDVALLANNHCCDGGGTGIRTTIEELERRHIRHTGAFADSCDWARNRILYLEHDSLRIALINYTYGTNGMPIPRGCRVHLSDTLQMAQTLRAIDRNNTDCIIACLHWGNEYERRPNRSQRQMADFLHRHGVEVIIGSHPHVVQPVEADSARVVAWSLGNLVSNQRKRYTDGGLALRLVIERRDTLPCRLSAEVIPLWVALPHYQILPFEVADTLPLPDEQRRQYELFRDDTRQLLAKSVL